MKSWKKRLNEEFEAAVPALSREVLNAPVQSVKEEEKPRAKKISPLKKRLFFGSGFVAAALAIVFTVLGVTGVFAPPAAPKLAGGVYTLEINPAVVFVTAENGKVLSVKSLNEDADVVLSDEKTRNKLINAPISEAVVAYTDAVVKAGYIDITKRENAVKLSYVEWVDEDRLNSVTESLQDYFKQKGVYAAIVEKFLTKRELCEKVGVAVTNKTDELFNELESLSAFFADRSVKNASTEELQNLYNEYIVGKSTLEYVKKELISRISDIAEGTLLLKEIGVCNAKIFTSIYNPGLIINYDYWRIKSTPNLTYNEEFAALIKEMDGLIDEYEQKFGKKIATLDEYNAVRDAFSAFQDVNIKDFLTSLTVADFRSSLGKYITVLKNIGYDTSALETIINAPQTAEEYFGQLRVVMRQTLLSREEGFENVYSAPREQISATDYDDYISEIIAKYGSLENFWENLKNS
ncbi:MAG: hypothetical protein SO003_03690 [Candidatus Borkfalkiaceae bacterium]|nr:hypothetical protein [Christensenellaceae bacterium]